MAIMTTHDLPGCLDEKQGRGVAWPPPEDMIGRVFSPSSRGRLTDRDLDRFPGGTLFDRLARAVCHAGCLPRKELYEAWEVARRVRRLFRGGRIVDLGGGHGLLAQALLILDDTSPCALVADKALPPSAAKLHEVLVQAWRGSRAASSSSRPGSTRWRSAARTSSCRATRAAI